jgi:6-phosphogluconolactonase
MIVGVSPDVDLRVFDDAAALAEAAAQFVVEAARESVRRAGRFTIALAGGGTPRATYTRLAQAPHAAAMPWSQTHVFFGDERCVPHDHADSNFRMANESLLSRVPLPASQVFPVPVMDDPEAVATEYARTLAQAFGTRRGELPRFDLVLLGMGLDGHTASLFPGSPVLKEVFRPVAAVHVAAAAIPQRVTLTFPVLNAAARVAFLVAGTEKAKAVKAVLREGALLPSAMVKPTDGALVWMVDRGAASLLG